jgi:hypothetical protein
VRYLAFTAALAFACGFIPYFLGGCAHAPSVPQQAAVASYTAALEACAATAKTQRMNGATFVQAEQAYASCRDNVDKQYGRAPEDAGTE